jgi:hypothetical protein
MVKKTTKKKRNYPATRKRAPPRTPAPRVIEAIDQKTNPVGRPSLLSDAVIEQLKTVLQTGAFIETAVAFVGINRDTFYDWMKRGTRERTRIESGQDPDPDEAMVLKFSDTMKKAIAGSEVRVVGIIAKAADKNWTAAAWIAERKYPDRWGRQRLEITGKDGEAFVAPVALAINMVRRNDDGEIETTEIKAPSRNIRTKREMELV